MLQHHRTLDWPVTVRDDGVVIRGRGAQKTKILDNQLSSGNGQFVAGVTPPERMTGNRQLRTPEPPRPAPPVPSIYEWQLGQARR